MVSQIINSKSKTFTAFCFSFIFGILIASIFNTIYDFVLYYFVFFVCIGFIIMFWKNTKARFVFLIIFFFTMAFFRYDIFIRSGKSADLEKLFDEKISFEGEVVVEPDIRIDSVRYIVKAQKYQTKFYIKNQLYPRYEYGDKLQIECNVWKPEPIENFRYDMYLAKFGVFAVCSSASINLLSNNKEFGFYKKILDLKNVFADRVNKLWHEPYSSFMAGLLYGYRGGLGDLQEDFNKTGVSHIVAISGYNISIIIVLLSTILIYAWVPRKKAFYLISFGVLVFVIFTGASGSVVRAGVMGFLAIFARQVGREGRAGNILICSAVIMLLFNPLLLYWDAGFQLSFLATIGLVYFSPLFMEKVKFDKFNFIKETAVSTLSAIIITFPLILFNFNRISIVAPIVNILILWIIPLLMLFGFLAVVLSFVFYPAGLLFSWIGFFGLIYIVKIVKFFSNLPFSYIDFSIPFYAVILLYSLIILLYWRLKLDKEAKI